MHDETRKSLGLGEKKGRLRTWFVVPGAAAAVSAVVAAAVVSLGPTGGGVAAAGQSEADYHAGYASGVTLTGVTHITELPALSFGKEINPGPIPVSQAVAEMVRAGERVQPVRLDNGQLIFVQSLGRFYVVNARAVVSQAYEVAAEPAGMIAVSLSRNGEAVPSSHLAANNRADFDTLANKGPSLALPTPEWIASLPSSPSALMSVLQSEVVAKSGSPEHAMLVQIGDLFFTSDLVVPAAQRVAFYQVLGMIPGVTALDTNIEGRRLLAFRHAENGESAELLLDPQNGRVVGRRTIALKSLPNLAAGDATHFALWTQSVAGVA